MGREIELLVNGARRTVTVLVEERNRVRYMIGDRTYDVAYELAVPTGTAGQTQSRAAAKPSRGRAANADEVIAPIPGLVAEVCVAPGDSVATGNVLLKLEAMKMQNNIVAPRDGVISAVHVEKGAEVGDHQLLVTFVPAANSAK